MLSPQFPGTLRERIIDCSSMMTTNGGQRRTVREARGPRPVGVAAGRVARPLIRRRGLAEAGVVADWPRIVGEETAAWTRPERLRVARGSGVAGGVLHLRVASGRAPELQHREPILIERINAYFGYRAVARLKIVQGLDTPDTAPTPPPRPLSEGEQQAIDRQVEAIYDDGLRTSLAALGRALATRKTDD